MRRVNKYFALGLQGEETASSRRCEVGNGKLQAEQGAPQQGSASSPRPSRGSGAQGSTWTALETGGLEAQGWGGFRDTKRFQRGWLGSGIQGQGTFKTLDKSSLRTGATETNDLL